MPTCARCSSPLFGDAPAGLCERCLLGVVLSPEPEPVLRSLGNYELLERIARGGMGVVYRARKAGDSRVVALKLGDEDDPRFATEARLASSLEHPNIVPIYDIGEHEERPYFTMKMLQGGTLADRLDALRGDRVRACELIIALAGAVHHAHQHGVLHRDLKPDNVLLDTDGKPYLADFGIAKELEHAATLTRTGQALGTPAYMSPEIASAGRRAVTVAVDVWGLGAIFYALLTGRPPFSGKTLHDVLAHVLEHEPERPSRLVAQLEPDLEAVCLKCLEKDPAHRYPSAEALATDLRRFLNREPVDARPAGRLRRAARLLRTYPVASGVTAAVFVAAIAALGLSMYQAGALRHEVTAANARVAHLAAGAVLSQLSEYGAHVAKAARDPTLVALLETEDFATLADAGFPRGVPPPGGDADSWLLLDARGCHRRRWPSPGHTGDCYDFRDYFRGAAVLGPGQVHVSRAFFSETDERLKFALASPMFAHDGGFLGVIGAHIATDSTVGRIAGVSVVGAADVSRDGGHDFEHVFLVHDGLEHGRQVAFEPGPALAGWPPAQRSDGGQWRVPEADRVIEVSDYRDPFRRYEGRWLAALGPVGDTGMWVVVQSRRDELAPLWSTGLQFGLPTLLGGLIVGASLLGSRRSARHRASSPRG